MAISLTKTCLVTIICESVLQDRLVHLLKTLEISGYTLQEARGSGGHGRRMGDIAGFLTNIELKVLVPLDLSEELFEHLQEYRSGHALIAFRQEVDALMD